jgi:hypothetical protein
LHSARAALEVDLGDPPVGMIAPRIGISAAEQVDPLDPLTEG